MSSGAVTITVSGGACTLSTDNLQALDTLTCETIEANNVINTGTSTFSNGLTVAGGVNVTGGIDQTSGDFDIADPSTLGTESLTNGALTSGTSWTATGDGALTGNAFTVTDSTHAAGLSQAAVTLAVAGVANRKYRFTYTVSASPTVIGTATITTAFALAATSLVLTAGTHNVDFYAAASPGAFTLAFVTSFGHVTIDTLSLKQITGGNVNVGGTVAAGVLTVAGATTVGGTLGVTNTTGTPTFTMTDADDAGSLTWDGNNGWFAIPSVLVAGYAEMAAGLSVGGGSLLVGSASDLALSSVTTNSNHIIGNPDIAGTAAFTTVATTKAITFGRTYAHAPLVFLQTLDVLAVGMYPASVTTTGFTATRLVGGTSGASFNYFAVDPGV